MTAAVSAHYSPAADGWIAIVSGSRVAFLDGATESDRVDAVLDALGSDDAVDALLAVLLRDGLSAMPAFAFAEVDPTGVRLLVRGDLTASVGGSEYRGSDYSTWGEHRAPAASEIELVAMAAGERARLPLGHGAAYASAVRLGGGARGEDAVGVEPEVVPAARPTPVSAPPTPDAAPPVPIADPPIAAPPTPIAAPPTEPTSIPEQTMVEFTLADADPGYSHLFEETIVRPIEHAAVRDEEPSAEAAPAAVPAPTAAEPVPAPAPFEEHDGLTIVSGDLAKLRAAAPPQQTAPTSPVQSASRPAVAELRFSSGLTEKLIGPVIIGRSPSSGKVSAGRVPRLVTITDDPDMSRSHLQIDMEGDAVVVTDLHSRNGTTVTLPGRPTERLRGGVPTTVIDKTVIDLGGGLTIEVREPTGSDA